MQIQSDSCARQQVMRWRRRFLALCVLAAGLALSAAPAAAARQASLVIDANTGQVLHADRADAPRYPASLTKMMTLYLVFDEIRAGRLRYDSLITFSAAAANAQPSKLGLGAGETISVIDAVKSLITKSANDVARAVAEHISGSRSAFAQRMTRRARELGMSATTFANASGLPNSSQLTTARDMLSLGLHLIDDYPQHYHLFSLRSFRYRGRTYRTHNALLSNFRGTDGLKTGYTRASGFNLVASVRRDGKHLIGAVFGSGSAGARNRKMRGLLSAAFKRASTVKSRRPRLIARLEPPAAAVPGPREPEPQPEAREAAQGNPEAPALVQDAIRPPPAQVPADPPVQLARVRPVPLAAFGEATGFARPPARPAEQFSGAAIARLLRRQELAPAELAPAQLASDLSTALPAASNIQPARSVASSAPLNVAGFVLPGLTLGPSTLDAQAARIAGGATRFAAPAQAAAGFEAPRSGGQASLQGGPQAFGLRGPQQIQAGDYQIQVGAYGTVGEAQRQIETVRTRAARLLGGYATLTMPVDSSGRRLFRARFAGFDNRNAAATCLELRRLQVDCFVARAN